MRRMCCQRRIHNIVRLALPFVLGGWTMYGGDLQNTRYKDISFNCKSLAVLWQFRPETHVFRYSPASNVWSQAVAAAIGEKTFIYIGSYDYNLYCIDADSGKEVFRFTAGDEIISGPVVFDIEGRFLVSFACRDRRIYCLDAETGQKVWTYEVYPWKFTTGKSVPSSGIYIPELNSLVFCMYVYDKKPFKIIEEGLCICLNPLTGEPVWRKNLCRSSLSSPAYVKNKDNHYLFVSSADGNIYALNPQTSEILWKFQLTGVVHASPCVFQKEDSIIVFIGDKFGYLFALDEKGNLLWKFKAGHVIDASPAILNRDLPRLFLPSFDRKIYCLNVFTGEKMYDFEAANYLYSSPLISKIENTECVFFSSLDNTLFVLNAETGKIIQTVKLGNRLWPYETYGETIWPSPIVIQGPNTYLIYPCSDGGLYCLGCPIHAYIKNNFIWFSRSWRLQ